MKLNALLFFYDKYMGRLGQRLYRMSKIHNKIKSKFRAVFKKALNFCNLSWQPLAWFQIEREGKTRQAFSSVTGTRSFLQL